jgi:hypothetical protein
MFPYTVVSTTSAPALVLLKGGQQCDLWGIIATSAEAANSMYVKLFWGGNNNAVPVLGTSIPDVTFNIPITGIVAPLDVPIVHSGPLWYAIVKNNVYTDATALATGGGLVTFLLD